MMVYLALAAGELMLAGGIIGMIIGRASSRDLKRDAAIGALVRKKLTSGNDVPVERCTVFASELVDL